MSSQKTRKESIVKRIRRGTFFHTLTGEKHLRAGSTGIVCAAGALILFVGKIYHLNFYQTSALLLGLVCGMMFAEFFYVMSSFYPLHWMRVKRKQSHLSDRLFVPYKFEEVRTKPMIAISNAIALRGSNLENMASMTIAVGCTIQLAACLTKVYPMEQDQATEPFELQHVMGIMAALGTYFAIAFPLEHFHFLPSDSFHYVGVALSGLWIGLYVMQNNYSMTSVSLAAIATISGSIYFPLWIYVQRSIFTTVSSVHRMSWTLILSEFGLISSMMTAFALYIYNL